MIIDMCSSADPTSTLADSSMGMISWMLTGRPMATIGSREIYGVGRSVNLRCSIQPVVRSKSLRAAVKESSSGPPASFAPEQKEASASSGSFVALHGF